MSQAGVLRVTAALSVVGTSSLIVFLDWVRTGGCTYRLAVEQDEVDADTFAGAYAGNLTVLPRTGDHVVVPDLQHLLSHTAVGLSCVLCWRAFALQTRCNVGPESGRRASDPRSAHA